MAKRQIFINTETTGISARSGHRIIELAAVEAIDGRLTGKTLHTYLDPERDIDPGAQRVHGITVAALVGKPKFVDIAQRFIDFVEGAECLMHNATFDCGFIDAELARADYTRNLRDLGQITCTLKLARQCFPGERASLDALIDRSGLGVIREKHSALEDAMLLAEVYFKILYKSSKSTSSILLGGVSSKTLEKSAKKESSILTASLPLATRQAMAHSHAVTPGVLGMERVIEMVGARQETFFYREKHKRIIDHRVINERRWKNIAGPLVYAVTDCLGLVRYIGKWESATPLYRRWLRRESIHHQERARNLYLAELDAGRGPLTVWSISVSELKERLPTAATHGRADASVAVGLEALWIHRWKEQLLWNNRSEPLLEGFHDGEYWKC